VNDYHVREWLNPEGTFATSTITAFHGHDPYYNEKRTNLVIASCHETAHIHRTNSDKDLHPFIDKVRLIANVCAGFADYLLKYQQELDFLEYLELVSINEKEL
jgi:hypothetical protein